MVEGHHIVFYYNLEYEGDSEFFDLENNKYFNKEILDVTKMCLN